MTTKETNSFEIVQNELDSHSDYSEEQSSFVIGESKWIEYEITDGLLMG